MDPITSQKARKRANKDLALIETQLADLEIRRATALAGYDFAEKILNDTALAIRTEMAKWDAEHPSIPVSAEEVA